MSVYIYKSRRDKQTFSVDYFSGLRGFEVANSGNLTVSYPYVCFIVYISSSINYEPIFYYEV